jgi:hypothetical protein
MSANIVNCVVCSKAINRSPAATDDHGRPVHEKCNALMLKVKRVRGEGLIVVRCPYCVEDKQFKPMKAIADEERFLCLNCGHVAVPGIPSYRCTCSKCAAQTGR